MLAEILEVMGRWLYIEDKRQIEIILAAALASQFPGDPVWLFAVGPSGSSKTEILRSLSSSDLIYTLDSVTPRSFISGFRSKDGTNPDLLPQLNGKLLIIKDLSPLLEQGSQKDKDSVFTVLRSAYDGYYEAFYGSGIGRKKSYVSTFGIIAGVTEVIDHYSKIHSLLGERFLKVRTRYDRHKSVQAALRHSGQEAKMRQEIADAVRISIDYWARLTSPPRLSEGTETKLSALGDCVSILRSPVPRDYRNEVAYLLRAEVATRLAKQFLRLAQSLHQIGCWDYESMIRVARDTIFPERLKIVQYLKAGQASITQVADGIKLPRHLTKVACEDLWLLDACQRVVESDSYIYSLNPTFFEQMEVAEL